MEGEEKNTSEKSASTSSLGVGIIVVLVLVAAVLGYLIVTGQSGDDDAVAQSTPVQNEPAPIPAGEQDATSENNVVVEEIDLYNEAIANAVVTDTINVTACTPSPKVLHASIMSMLTLINSEEDDVTIIFDESNVYTVEGNSSLEVVANFGKGTGLFGYGCSSVEGAVGSVLLVE